MNMKGLLIPYSAYLVRPGNFSTFSGSIEKPVVLSNFLSKVHVIGSACVGCGERG